jgi:branched-chain amino acid transport system ATP-binding protein
MSLLQVQNISKSFGGLIAINDVSFQIEASEIVALIGPNGAGKTTLINLLTNFVRPDAGHFLFDGTSLHGLPRHAIVKIGIARTFQSLTVFENLTVSENVNIGHSSRSNKMLTYLFSSRKKRIEMNQKISFKIKECLEKVNINRDYLDWKMSALSMIDQKKVAIACALASEPKLLLLDEPMAGLNQSEAHEILDLMRDLKNRGIAILLIDHNLEAVMSVADRVCVLNFGVLVYDGIPSEIARNKSVLEVYLGE